MKIRLLDILVCPKCKKEFEIQIFKTESCRYSEFWNRRLREFWDQQASDSGANSSYVLTHYQTEVMEGALTCTQCGEEFPIAQGIPIILPPELRTVQGKMGRMDPFKDIRVKTCMDQISPVGSHEKDLFNQIQMANQSNYGYEWKAFSHQYEEWETVYRKNYVLEPDEFFHGKLGLDAGCGMGRYTLVCANKGAEMVGLDLSNAIEATYGKSREVPLLHAVQGDIYNLPFRDNFFDFAQTLGVIHITPDPEVALLSLKRTVAEGKKIFIYVYPDFKGENKFRYLMLKVINQFRRITVKMPSNILYGLLYFVVPFVVLFLYFPSKILWMLGFKKLAVISPYNYQQYRGRKLRDIHMNLFDRFGNPVERRYSRDQMNDWMQRSGFKQFELFFLDGWVVSALK